MAFTNFANLATEELTVWSREVWKVARNLSMFDKFSGTGPGAMIQKITELTKSDRGARAVLTLVTDLEGDGVAGDRTLEGSEDEIKAYDQVIQLDQLRNANRHEGRMAEQKSVVDFRNQSRDTLAYWLSDRCDQLAFLTLSGVAYTRTTNGATRVGSDLPLLAFAADVTAPSTNRHRRWDAVSGLVAGDTTAVDTADIPTWQMLIEAKAYAKDNYIRPIRGDNGLELYNVFMTPQGIAKLKQDADFLAAWRNAMPRDKSNPLFVGAEVIYVDGLAIYEYRHVYNTKGAASGSKWGAASTVDGQRTLLCGAQALGCADIGPASWEEDNFDFKNQQAISIGKIFGLKKPVYHSVFNNADEDHGVLVVDCAI